MRYSMVLAVAAAACMFSIPVSAQVRGGGAPPSIAATPTEQSPFNGNMSQGEIGQLSDYIDKAQRLTKKTKPEDLAKDRAAAEALVATLQLPCVVTDAAAVAATQTTVNGKLVDATTYEVACGNGAGYLLLARDTAEPTGFSCFAADALRSVNETQGKNGSLVCSLQANQDMKTMAVSIATHLGKTCNAHGFAWIGQSVANKLDYTEIACDGGKGFVIATAAPGATVQPTVLSCAESSARGIKCALSDNGPTAGGATITLQTFKDALAQHGVACQASDERVVGQENVKKRYVVEFTCPQQPSGLVAFIPLAGNSNPFETLSCAEASKRGIACKLTTRN